LIGVILIAFALGVILGYAFVTRKKKNPYFASAEYWVFLPKAEMPDHEAIMTEMISRNPYSRRGVSPIGSAEGLIFSDVRLHIALVLRSKNPHAFRPYIFEDVDELTPETLDALDRSHAFVKLRYVSEEPLKDKRHLQFLVHAADTVGRLGASEVIYDHVCGTLKTPPELSEQLKTHFDATHPEIQVRIRWFPHTTGGHLETKGLVKVGLPELKTDSIEADEQLIARAVLEEAIAKTWPLAAIPDPWEVEAFGDRFQILPGQAKDRTTQVRILRVQSV
jgi:hypothetical protein